MKHLSLNFERLYGVCQLNFERLYLFWNLILLEIIFGIFVFESPETSFVRKGKESEFR